MAIWTAEIKELEKLYESLKGQLPDLEKELGKLIKSDDENMVLLYSRRCLEVIVTDLCECELKRPRKTEPLQGIIDKLHKEEKVPSHIIASMHGLNELSTYGAHPKDFDPKQVRTTLINLETIIEWYLKHKEGGAEVVTRSAEGTRQEVKSIKDVKKRIQIPRKRLISFIAGSILLIVIAIAVLFFTNIIGGGKKTKELEKSIAVLPFRNDSPDTTNTYFINGLMDELLNNLMKISNFRILSRTSTEQYQGTNRPTIPEIARKLGVNYIIEGSGQKYANKFRLRVQLIKAKGKESHLWANSYEQELRETSDLFDIQSLIAQTIAQELKTTITPEEKRLIEKIPTGNMTALDLYWKAKEFEEAYEKTRDTSSLQKAAVLYRSTIKMDSTFAKAYTGLASANFYKYYGVTYFTEHFLDSCLILANKALSLDNKLDKAYYIISRYYYANGHFTDALGYIDKILKINPNYSKAFVLKAAVLGSLSYDLINVIENYNKALALIYGDERPNLLRALGSTYQNVGFPDKAKQCYQEAVDLDDNKLYNYAYLAWLEFSNENFEGAFKLEKERDKIDSANYVEGQIPIYSISSGHDKEAYLYANKLIEYYKKSGILNIAESHRIGYAFWQVGKQKEALNYFNQQIKYDEESIKLNRNIAQSKLAYYDLAATYAFLGNKAMAYQYLDEYNTKDFYPLSRVIYIKHDPLFDSLRNEERFQKIVKNVEAKYNAEHERVKKWLEEQGML